MKRSLNCNHLTRQMVNQMAYECVGCGRRVSRQAVFNRLPHRTGFENPPDPVSYALLVLDVMDE